MTDFKTIHQDLVREDHDFRQGWSAARIELAQALYLLAGIVMGLILGAVL